MSLIGYVTRIHFADRVLDDALPDELRALGVVRPLVLTDGPGEVDEGFDRLADLLPGGTLAFRRIDDDLARAGRAAALTRIAATGADAVIGLGGVVALDLARIAAGQALPGAPVIALPATTASVGLGPVSEALAQGAVPTPALILCDPTLTLAADPAATAADGMDALIHCLEAYLGTAWNPPADGIALEGLRRAAAHLERAVARGGDLEARREMLASALNAGLAAQKGLGGVHALALAIEAEARGTRHGRLHAALLPPVMSFNAPAVADRLPALRHALGLDPGADVIAALAALGQRIGLPARLTPLHLDAGALARVASRAAEGGANRTNPRHATAADYRHMLEAAL
jgi:alcohol dehydrogenase class IV